MVIKFNWDALASATDLLLRWYDTASVLVLEQSVPTWTASPVPNTQPPQYQISAQSTGGWHKPPSGSYLFRIAGKNSGGIGPETASIPVTIGPPTSAPTNVVIVDPNL